MEPCAGFPFALSLPSPQRHFLERSFKSTTLHILDPGSVFKAEPTHTETVPLLLLEITS